MLAKMDSHVALQTRQLLDRTALVAAQSRAQSLAGARTTASDAHAQVQFNQLLTALSRMANSASALVR
jgi:conjugal transfer/entry exclusion protein